MPQFSVQLDLSFYPEIEVECDDTEEAIQEAVNEAIEAGVLHQMGHAVDTNNWEVLSSTKVSDD